MYYTTIHLRGKNQNTGSYGLVFMKTVLKLSGRPSYMEFAMQATTKWKRGHIWDILATVQPHSFGLGISAPPPCFRVLFGKVQQCCISRELTTGDLKSHHLQAGVTALSVPPPFLSCSTRKKVFFKRHSWPLRGWGGGARAPQAPPPLGSGTAPTNLCKTTLAIRTTVVPIRILIRTTVVPIRILIRTTVVPIRILIRTTGMTNMLSL